MSDDTLSVTIANGNTQPNGTSAIMSRSGDGHPRHATWRALDKDYTITFLPEYWVNPPVNGYVVISKQATSDQFELRSDAPLGIQEPIAIDPAGPAGVPPTIMIQP